MTHTKKAINIFLLTGFFIFLIWLATLNGLIPAAEDLGRLIGFQKDTIPVSSSPEKSSFNPDQYRNIPLTSVDPTHVYNAFLSHYTLVPDSRFIESFSVLCDLYWKFSKDKEGVNPWQIGKTAFHDQNTVFVPVLKDNKEIGKIKLPLAPTFDRFMTAAHELLELISESAPKGTPGELTEADTAEIEKSLEAFRTMDPRWITTGLVRLEKLWANKHHPNILAAASKGYGMLLFNYRLSSFKTTDPFASYACSLLAFARWLDPSLSDQTVTQEALLAFHMGYMNHVEGILKSHTDQKSLDDQQKALLIYLKGDLNHLQELQAKNPDDFFISYLLVNLFRKMGLWNLAEIHMRKFVHTFPSFMLTAVEGIYSLDLNERKRLTVMHPLSLLNFIQLKAGEQSLLVFDPASWEEEAMALFGEKSWKDISINEFDRLLQKWNPLKNLDSSDVNFMIDSRQARKMYLALYEEALYFRFNILLNQWGVIETARQFVDNLMKRDGEHPLLLRMQMELALKSSGGAERKKLCIKVMTHPTITGYPVTTAFSNFEDKVIKLRYAPQVIAKFDSRPEHLYYRGFIFQDMFLYDMAEQMLQTGLSLNEYDFRFYWSLAEITKDWSAIYQAAGKFPVNFKMMLEAGDFMTKQDTHDAKLKALDYYESAGKIAPEEKSVMRKTARVLSKLERYQDSIDVLEQWLTGRKSFDLEYSSVKTNIADNYLRMNNPQKALEILSGPNLDSYKASVIQKKAQIFEALGKLDDAEKQWEKASKRYPNLTWVMAERAGFYWRQGKNVEAARYIAKGRRQLNHDSRWYFDTFYEVFANKDERQIMSAVENLIMTGAGPWEISALGHVFQYDRPQVAFQIVAKKPANTMMPFLEKQVALYKLLKHYKNESEAMRYLKTNVTPNQYGPLTMVFFKEGLFQEIITILDNINALCPRPYTEFCWLQKLLAWAALEKNPPELESGFESHYSRSSADYYHAVGKFLMGKITEQQLLSLVKNDKQLCEFSYYIGFSQRLKEHYALASNWYFICRSTLLSNNGEFHWALTEMFWWAHMGTKNRHRLMTDDMKQYHLTYKNKQDMQI